MAMNEKKEKKGLGIREIVETVGVLVTILIAGTSLLSSSGNVPWWWFHFSFIFLIALTFFIPSVIFFRPLSKKLGKFKLKRKQNAIARKHFLEFKDLVDTSRQFNSSMKRILDSLRTHYQNDIKSSLAIHTLQSHSESEIRNVFIYVDKELDESNKTFRDLYLIMKHFEFVLNIYERNLKIIEEFAREMQNLRGKPIAKGIEAEFESFREKYNYFVKDFTDYCRKVNQELGEREFPEWAIDYVKKW